MNAILGARLRGAAWALLIAFLGLLSVLSLWLGDLFRISPIFDWDDAVKKGVLLIFAGTYLAGISISYATSGYWRIRDNVVLWGHGILPALVWFLTIVIYINIRLTPLNNLNVFDLRVLTYSYTTFVVLYGMYIRGYVAAAELIREDGSVDSNG